MTWIAGPSPSARLSARCVLSARPPCRCSLSVAACTRVSALLCALRPPAQVQAHSLIIATGATAKRLGIPKEQAFWSKGISACAICDGAH